jgi:REP element-mobilizing transposase RayT
LVCPAKYRKKIFTKEVSNSLKNVCKKIGEAYELLYFEIGLDEDHTHFLIQSIPPIDPKKIVRITKSITARELFKIHPQIRKELWVGGFWKSGYFISAVGKKGNESVI